MAFYLTDEAPEVWKYRMWTKCSDAGFVGHSEETCRAILFCDAEAEKEREALAYAGGER